MAPIELVVFEINDIYPVLIKYRYLNGFRFIASVPDYAHTEVKLQFTWPVLCRKVPFQRAPQTLTLKGQVIGLVRDVTNTPKFCSPNEF